MPQALKTRRYVYGVEVVNGYDAWKLFRAAADGDVAAVKALLAKDPRLVNAQVWYQFPIHFAVVGGHAEVVDLLLDRGADPGQSRATYNSWDKLLCAARERGYADIESALQRAMRERFNYRPEFERLQEAILARDARKIARIVRDQPELITASDALGNNALHWSVLTRQLDFIERFVDLGTPLEAQRADGQTPAQLAVSGSDYWYRAQRGRSHPSLRNAWVMVGFLLAKGARYTISIASAVGDQERVEALLRDDPRLATALDASRSTPLTHAASSGYLHIVKLLLERGADPNLPEDGAPNGRALYEASVRNDLELAMLLLEHGANPNAGVDSSECCLTIGTIYHGDRAKPLQALLRQHGAYLPPYKMNVRQLAQAIRDGHEVVHDEEFLGNVMQKTDVKLLELYLKSDPSVPKRMEHGGGITYPKSPRLIRKLLEYGLDPNQTDWLGKTYLHACAEKGDVTGARIFLEAGADINAVDFEFRGTPLATAVRAAFNAGGAESIARTGRMIRFLLNQGAKVDLPKEHSWATPLAWAQKLEMADVMMLLRANQP